MSPRDRPGDQLEAGNPACGEEIVGRTESVCPRCLRRLPAVRVARGEDIYLRKDCPEHGPFCTVTWRGAPSFRTWVRPKLPSSPEQPLTAVERGCPFDCGLCPDHRQTSCCVLLEVTQRCDLRCRVCFADAGQGRTRDVCADPPLEQIEGWYRRLSEAAGPVNVQLSGGEPTLRDDLPDIIRMGRDLGFSFFQLNTNGLRIARDPEYLHRLSDAGLSTVFLQFDSLRDEANLRLRGRPLTTRRRQAIERCAEAGIGVVLVPTIVPGVNLDDLGPLVRYALDLVPAVRGVHVQPVSYFGRYPGTPADEDRITLPEVMRTIEAGTGGRIPLTAFAPSGGSNAWCSFHANFVVMPDGDLFQLTTNPAVSGCCPAPVPARDGAIRSRTTVARLWSGPRPPQPGQVSGCCRGGADQGPSLGGWDAVLDRARTHTFSVSGMAFQDAWNLDLERLRDCYLHHVSPDGLLIPFCAYNLTDATGTALYRPPDGAAGLTIGPTTRPTTGLTTGLTTRPTTRPTTGLTAGSGRR